MDLNIGQIFFLVWCGVLSNFTKGYFMYDIQTVQLLCETQCSALCVDQNNICDDSCASPYQYWIAPCDTGPNCGGTCAVRSRYFVESLLPDLPQLYPPMVKGHEIGLQWVQNLTPHNTVLYVVQTKQQGIQQSWNNTSWNNTAYELRITKYTIEVPDVCSNYYFRVMSINQYGSKGFSEWATVSRQAFKPGKVENVQSVRGIVEDSGIYYHPNSKEFMAIIRWDDVKNFQRDEIHYEWETMSRMNCNASLMKEPMVNVLPIIEQINLNDSNPNHFRMLIRVAEDAYGCSYQTGVRAVTSCGIKGPITNFKFDLSDCSRINNYSCNLVNKPFRQPGPASNVSTCAVYSQPYVHLRLTWQPPEDLGSKGIVDHYIIIWGFVAINPFPMPPSFLGTPNITRVESGVRMIEIGVEYSYLPAVYGFQLIPVAPGQNGTENNYLFEIHTISIDNNNNPMNPHRMMGKVILQCNDVKVVQIANTLDVDVSWQPLSRKLIPSQPSSHECHDSYSLRWGSLSNLGQMMSQNTEIATDNENETSIILHIEDPKPVYGFKLIGICEDDMEEDIESKWKIATLHTFRVEEVEISNTTAVPDTADGNSSKASLTLAVVCGVIIPIVLILGICFFKRKQAAKRKLQNLSVINRSLLNFNHYYKVNPLSSPDTLPSTVVADAWELPHSGVRAGRVLGKGAFGLVFKGLVCKGLLLNRSTILPNNLVTEGNDVPVAIKILLDSAGESFRKDFLREINLMKKIGYHENVVSMLGCCTLCDPICLIVEHVPFGDLLSYLKNIRQKMLKQDHTQNPYVNNEDDGLSPSDLLSFAMQIAIGMEFLSSKGFIHRDLAARNVLVGHHKTVKIGDFGLTRYIYNDAIYINRKGGKLPLKWMSIEAIFELTFSQASDVWSFGIVLFEIVTLGGTPYPTVDPHDLLGVLRSGYRMEKPENCSHELYQLMLDCWRTSPQDRPSFADLKNTLQDMLTKHMPSDFLDVRLNKNNIYYTVSSPDVSEQVSMESTDAERVTEASDTIVIQPYRTKYADETETSCNSILNDNLVLNGEYIEAQRSDCSDCVVTYKKSINLPVDNDKKLRSNKEISEKHDITANKLISTCQQKNYQCTNNVVSVPSINDNIETIGANYETSDSENEGDNVCSTFAIVECDVHCDSNQDTPSVERLMHTDSGMFENPDECTSLFEATRLCICRIHRTQRDSGIDGASISNAGMSPKNSPISSHGNHKESSGPEDEVFLAEEMTVDAGNSKHARQFSGSENRCLVCGGILGGSFESSLEDEDDANKTVLACQEMSTSSNIRNITSQTAHKKHMYSSSSEDVDIGKVDDCYLNGLPSIMELETRDTKF